MKKIALSFLTVLVLCSLLLITCWMNSFAEEPEVENDAFEVTHEVYESSYKDNPDYVLVETIPYYQYSSRTKSTTTSGYDSLDGWIKYDTKTSSSTSGYKFGTPIDTSTSYANNRKTVTSAVNKGYYYYAYAVANPSKTSDWTYYVDKTRAAVVSHMKANFSASSTWDESRLRYFWYISSKDLGTMSGKLNQNIPYCENSNVSVGETSQSGTHLFDLKLYKHKQCYKIKTDTTTNYFYKWSAWEEWTEWTQDRVPLPGDGSMRENTETRYLIKPVKLTKQLSECKFSLTSNNEFDYDGTEKHIVFEINDAEKQLQQGIDFAVSGNSAIDAGTYTVKITGLGDYAGELTEPIIINKVNPVLAFEKESITKSIDAEDFINALSAITDGEMSYSSSDKSVATVGADGVVSIVGKGTTVISVHSTQGVNYLAGDASFDLSIANNLYDCSIDTIGNTAYIYDGTEKKLKFSIIDGEYELVEGKDYEIMGNSGIDAGHYSVTVSGLGEYVGQIKHELTINKAAPILQFELATIAKRIDDDQFINAINAVTDGQIEYSSSDNSIATIDTYGRVALHNTGTVTIVASSSEGKNYKQGRTSYSLTVSDSEKELKLDELSYSFKNTWNDFGYARDYTIPASIYRMMFGKVVGNTFYLSSKNTSWGGNCAGISGTAALLYDKENKIHVKSFNQGVLLNKDLKVNDQTADQLSLLQFIEGMQIAQRASIFNVADNQYKISGTQLRSGKKTLNLILSTVTEQTEAGIPVVMTIRCKGVGGHALLAYKTVIEGDRGEIYVYDSNHPLENESILMNKDSSGNWHSWSYNMGSNGMWGSEEDYGECSIGMVPYGVIKTIWEQRGEGLQKNYNLLATNSKSIEIYDVEDNLIADIDVEDDNYANNNIVRHSGDLSIGSDEKNRIVLSMPVDVYKIKNADENVKSFELEMMNSELGSTVETSANEVTLITADDYEMNEVYIDATPDDFYNVTLNSSAKNDNEKIIVEGNGSGDTLQISQSAGVVNVENCQIASMSIDDNQIAQKTIKARSYGHGSISPDGNEKVIVGSDKVFNITPDEGYEIQDVVIDDQSIGAVDSYIFKNVTKDHEIVAIFDTMAEVKKIDNTIYASDINVISSTKDQTIAINASNDGNTNMIYRSSNNNVRVDENGVITINKDFVGTATITIISVSDKIFNQAEKKITVTASVTQSSSANNMTQRIALKSVAGFKVKANKGKKAKIIWKKAKGVSGYEIQYSSSKVFNNSKIKRVKGAKKKTAVIKKLKTKGYYFFRIRSYKIGKDGEVYSNWSKTKRIKVKK